MMKSVAHQSMKCFRAQRIFFSAYTPTMYLKAVGQIGILMDGFPSNIEHGIGPLHADDCHLRIARRKSYRDIAAKIENLVAAKGGELLRKRAINLEFGSEKSTRA